MVIPGKKKFLPEKKWKDRIYKNDEYPKVMSRNSILKTITQAKFNCTTHVLYITLHLLLVSWLNRVLTEQGDGGLK